MRAWWLVALAAAGCGGLGSGPAETGAAPTGWTLIVDGARLQPTAPAGAAWCAEGAPEVRVVASLGGVEGATGEASGTAPVWRQPVLSADVGDFAALFVDVRARCGDGAEFRVGAAEPRLPSTEVGPGGVSIGPFGNVESLRVHFVAGDDAPAGGVAGGEGAGGDEPGIVGGDPGSDRGDPRRGDPGSGDPGSGRGDPGRGDPGSWGDPGNSGGSDPGASGGSDGSVDGGGDSGGDVGGDPGDDSGGDDGSCDDCARVPRHHRHAPPRTRP